MFIETPTGVRIYYTQAGHGKEDLVLIGGLTTNQMVWDLLMPYLLPYYRILRFDNRGAGQSDMPASGFSIKDMAGDVIALMDHLAIPKAFIVGHSMGGAILQSLLVNYPGRIRKAVICGSMAKVPLIALVHIRTSSDLRRSGVSEALILETVIPWIFGSAWIQHPDRMNEIIEILLSNPWPITAAGYDAQVSALEQFDMRKQLEKIPVETLVIAGGQDKLIPQACSRYIHRSIPGSRFEIIKKSGHMLQIEFPQELADLITQFCKNLSG